MDWAFAGSEGTDGQANVLKLVISFAGDNNRMLQSTDLICNLRTKYSIRRCQQAVVNIDRNARHFLMAAKNKHLFLD